MRSYAANLPQQCFQFSEATLHHERDLLASGRPAPDRQECHSLLPERHPEWNCFVWYRAATIAAARTRRAAVLKPLDQPGAALVNDIPDEHAEIHENRVELLVTDAGGTQRQSFSRRNPDLAVDFVFNVSVSKSLRHRRESGCGFQCVRSMQPRLIYEIASSRRCPGRLMPAPASATCAPWRQKRQCLGRRQSMDQK